MATRRKRTTYSITPATRRAVLYARYSSTMQQDGWSIEAQTEDLRTYCGLRGWAIMDTYADEAISGSTDERPGFQAAMAAVRGGRANMIVVHKLDRFFRGISETFDYIDELERHGAGLVCTQQGIDTTNPVSGKIVIAVLAALAEVYLDNLSEETSKGKRARAHAGLPNGDLPYGYTNPDAGAERSGKGLANRAVPSIVPAEAEVVRLAFSLYATGQWSDAKIAYELNARGHKMRSKRHPDGYPFTKDTLTAMLDNPFYAGWVAYTGDGSGRRAAAAALVKGKHEPIIAQGLFDCAVAARAARTCRGRRDGTPRVYIASGLVRCQCCDQPLRAAQINEKPFYRTTGGERGVACRAGKLSIPEASIAEALGAAMRHLRLPADWQVLVEREMEALLPEAGRDAAKRAHLEGQLAHFYTLVKAGIMPADEYLAERGRIEAEIAALTPTQDGLEVGKAAKLVQDLPALWAEAAPEEQRELASHLFEAIYCDLDERRVVAFQWKRAFLPLRNALPSEVSWGGSDGIRTRDLLRDRQAC